VTSAALDTGFTSAPPRSPAVALVERIAGGLPTVGISRVTGDLALLARVDQKYVVPLPTLERLLELVRDDIEVLEIDGLRCFRYETTYFDTPDLMTFRAHAQGRRRRYKVRVRSYLDSGESMLEVKLKGGRGETLKRRLPYHHRSGEPLSAKAHAFASEIIGGAYGIAVPEVLSPTVTTTTNRLTLVSARATARMTVDMDLECLIAAGGVGLRDDHVVVETKAAGGDGRLDRALRLLGARPVSLSKYCLGVAVLHDDVSGNRWHRTARSFFVPHSPVANNVLSRMP
jgi:hypothetical protein